MKIKVEKNFKCNGVRGQKGQWLKKSDAEKLGKDQCQDLLNKGYILLIDEKVKDISNASYEEEKPKKSLSEKKEKKEKKG